MRVAGGCVVVHNPKFCPYSVSLDTASTYLSEDSSDQGLGSDIDAEAQSESSWIV